MDGKRTTRVVKISVVAVAGALLLLGAGTATARYLGHGPFAGGHGAFGLGAQVGHLVAELDLSPDQKQYLDNIHAIVEEKHRSRAETHGEHLQLIMGRIEQGDLDPAEVNLAIDEHLEQARIVAHDVAGELVTLVNSLDDEQRQLLADRLWEMSERLEEHKGHFGASRRGQVPANNDG